jgi:hypothetical protein
MSGKIMLLSASIFFAFLAFFVLIDLIGNQDVVSVAPRGDESVGADDGSLIRYFARRTRRL